MGATAYDDPVAPLIAAAAAGDASAWDTLVERFSGLLWATARSHRLDMSDAADVVQTTWLRLLENLDRMLGKADQVALSKLPADQAIARMAELGGLADYVKLRGIPRAKFDQCLADPAQLKAVNDLRNQAVNELKLTGTPSFIINGTVQEGVFSWADLETKLQAALR